VEYQGFLDVRLSTVKYCTVTINTSTIHDIRNIKMLNKTNIYGHFIASYMHKYKSTRCSWRTKINKYNILITKQTNKKYMNISKLSNIKIEKNLHIH